ncbi:hypothetical protein [Caldalkalibacillus salinus]|uniref:hypothetical protein n=1 Tax=Caldalkalibacillus salinus TaxID=2803787 RepID=UPI001923D637|nr:hypothetical protein [Caldalkalibacillus salinus]
MGCTVHDLLERVSSQELTEWMAFYKIKAEEMEKEQKEMDKNMKSKQRARR